MPPHYGVWILSKPKKMMFNVFTLHFILKPTNELQTMISSSLPSTFSTLVVNQCHMLPTKRFKKKTMWIRYIIDLIALIFKKDYKYI